MVPQERGGCLGYTVNKRWGSRGTLCTDGFQFSSLTSVTVQVKYRASALPGARASSRTERARLPLPPWDGLGLLWNLKGQRLFLAGAEVQIQARDGEWRQEAGYFLRVCCLRA